MKKTLLIFFGVCTVLGSLLAWVIQSGYRLIVTPSVPMGVWKVSAFNRPLRHGDMVWLCPPDTKIFRAAKVRDYVSNGDCPGNYLHMMKPVAALPGDRVMISLEGVSVNGRYILNSKPMGHDPQGRKVAFYPAGTYLVVPGTVWLVSHFHPLSYDSRYFGSVPVKQIQGIAVPVWVKRNDAEP